MLFETSCNTLDNQIQVPKHGRLMYSSMWCRAEPIWASLWACIRDATASFSIVVLLSLLLCVSTEPARPGSDPWGSTERRYKKEGPVNAGGQPSPDRNAKNSNTVGRWPTSSTASPPINTSSDSNSIAIVSKLTSPWQQFQQQRLEKRLKLDRGILKSLRATIIFLNRSVGVWDIFECSVADKVFWNLPNQLTKKTIFKL